MSKLLGRAAATAFWLLLLLGAPALGYAESHKALDVRGDVVSISESRPPVTRTPESVHESQKRKLNKEKLRSTKAAPAATSAIPQRLARDARWLARHGGITGTCHGCATVRMKQLVKKLVVARFAPAGAPATRTAVCLADAESGFNPGAISDSDDWGTGQINRPSHKSDHPSWWRPHAGFRYAVLDPVYNVGIMFAMSSRGRFWSAWTGTWGLGMCR